ncbi:MAG: Flp family type IVb pilin [Zavarzinella sp.]
MIYSLKLLVSFLKKEDGPTAVEFAIMLALIAAVCVGVVSTLGTGQQVIHP